MGEDNSLLPPLLQLHKEIVLEDSEEGVFEVVHIPEDEDISAEDAFVDDSPLLAAHEVVLFLLVLGFEEVGGRVADIEPLRVSQVGGGGLFPCFEGDELGYLGVDHGVDGGGSLVEFGEDFGEGEDEVLGGAVDGVELGFEELLVGFLGEGDDDHFVSVDYLLDLTGESGVVREDDEVLLILLVPPHSVHHILHGEVGD